VERLDRTAVDVLKTALERQPLTEAKVAFAWAIAAGPALARAASVAWAGGTLTVTAKSEAWRRELERARPVVLGRLRHLLGGEALSDARLVIVAAPESDLRSPPRRGFSP
jgi:hypothetical protein